MGNKDERELAQRKHIFGGGDFDPQRETERERQKEATENEFIAGEEGENLFRQRREQQQQQPPILRHTRGEGVIYRGMEIKQD